MYEMSYERGATTLFDHVAEAQQATQNSQPGSARMPAIMQAQDSKSFDVDCTLIWPFMLIM